MFSEALECEVKGGSEQRLGLGRARARVQQGGAGKRAEKNQGWTPTVNLNVMLC